MENKYIPLYRKYRPQTFYDLIGQENIVNALSNAISLNKIAHAYLLCGPRGTGKTSSARILAKSLNCKEGPTLKPCGKCPSCIDITNSTPVDVIEIDAASNRSVEDTQAILEKIQYVPVNGKYKIYVIDEVHMLSNHAFNALLKTLEEPPSNVIFILATTEPHKVLETIVSRCQRFDFRRITTEDIVKRLEFIAQEEKINITKEALYSIAKNSAGGMRDAVALLDQISVLNKQIDTEDIDELLGKISYDMLFEIAQCIVESHSGNAIELIDKIYNKGNEPVQIINNLIQYFRDLLILKNCQNKDLIFNLTRLNENYLNKIKPQAENFKPEQIVFIIDKLSYYATQIKETTNKYLWLELCIIDLTSVSNISSILELSKRIDALEAKLGSENIQQVQPNRVEIKKPEVKVPEIKATETKISETQKSQTSHNPFKEEIAENPVVKAEPEKAVNIEPEKQEEANHPVSTAPQNSQSLETSDINQLWLSLLQNIESTPSRTFYQSLAKPISIDKNRIVISFMKEVFVKQAKEDVKQIPLKSAAGKLFNVQDIIIQVNLANENDSNSVVTKPIMPDKKKIDVIPEKNNIQADEENEYCEEIIKKSAPISMNINQSDQAKMVMQLFDGKYLD